ncbi:DUF4913 domain-containing protein [Nocardia paucivorans]|uniref:DUF4913 domain-containing protein n=1 Tax=Nocardia paucivorans TaxID=114259 RepID=UPI000684C074|nr:DUF4913 domain-containing protein [Nocardia paucivorans]
MSTTHETRADHYRSLGRFLEDFLAPAYARYVTGNPLRAWCPEPWLHDEGVLRLWEIWQGYEQAMAAPDRTAVSEWWLLCADPHMAALMDPDGPFKFCSVLHGHKDMLAPLPMRFDAAPAELYREIPQASAASDAAA